METPKSGLAAALHFIGKLWVIVTAVIGSFVVIGIALLVMAFQDNSSELSTSQPTQRVIEQKGSDKVALIHLTGTIVGTDTESGFATGSEIAAPRVIELLRQAEKDASIKAVVLVINSPGGAVVASDEIYHQLRQLQQKKVVVAYLSDVAASGGYYIATATNKIIANPATITGSIGVIAQFPKLSGLYDKLGIEMRTLKSGEFKDIGSPDRDLTPAETAILDSVIRQAYDQFVGAVATGREMDEAKVRQLADGRIYTGQQAKENGLIDELGTLNTAVTQAQELAHISNATIIEYSDESFLESLLQSKLASGLGLGVLTQFAQALPTQKIGVYYLLSL